MLDFIANLTSFDGGFKSPQEALQIAQDMLKFLAHADPSTARWSVVTNQEKLKSFVNKLESSGVGPNGICTKIDRLVTALQYATRTSFPLSGSMCHHDITTEILEELFFQTKIF